MHISRITSVSVPAAFIALALCGCGHKSKVATAPTHAPPAPHAHAAPAIPAPPGTTEEGLASWYGPPYHGRQAADGEIYDMEKLTAAHRTMPFNTWVHVTNLSNGRTVDVRITDRGPFVDGRIIDLSKAAARQIELLGPGVGPVRLQVISAPHPDTDVIAAKLTTAPNAPVVVGDFYAVQVGAYSVHENAEHLRVKFADEYGTSQLVVRAGNPTLYRVLVGKAPSVAEAQDLAARLQQELGFEVYVVHLDPTPVSPTSAPASQVAP
ncbi:MAG: septal ring lytic transglycosylase RlpA family protein [Bryobacteraceae bacterium]